jgi:hypothetical protein
LEKNISTFITAKEKDSKEEYKMIKENHKGIVLRIKDIAINRSYGFRDGGRIVVGHYYKNNKPVKGVEDIVFSERSDIVERYAKACGINREDQLHKLIGLEVATEFEIEDGYDGELYDVEYLTRPFKISEKLGLNKFDYIVGNVRGTYVEDEEEAV